MIRSMTGFARRETQTEWGSMSVEMRTVNHRFLEPHLRLPEELRPVEPELRKLLASRLGRGKIDLGVRLRYLNQPGSAISVDEDLAAALVATAGRLAGTIDNPAAIDPVDILRWPGVVVDPPRDFGPVQRAAMALVGETLDVLDESRRAEGARMHDMLVARLDSVDDIVAGVRRRLPEVRQAMRDKLVERLEQLPLDSDDVRLEQELVIHAQKMDVDEELDRLGSHVTEVRDVLARDEPVGRRLDFLMQEFNRESNTLASKAQDAETTRAAVDLKVLIEQMREQVQNVE